MEHGRTEPRQSTWGNKIGTENLFHDHSQLLPTGLSLVTCHLLIASVGVVILLLVIPLVCCIAYFSFFLSSRSLLAAQT